MSKPLVTITIPTYNSAETIDKCIKSIKNQTYKRLEINIIDGYSSDKTIQILKKLKVGDINLFRGSLLGARIKGVGLAKGKYTLILDSDQILQKSSIERAVRLSEEAGVDMVNFKESVFKAETLIEKLFEMDRRLIETVNDLSPFTGVIMPRFFKTSLLKKAYNNIPKKFYPSTGGPDHAIVYFEAWKLSKKISSIPNAVKHIEPSTLKRVWTKFFRWGYTSTEVRTIKEYKNLMEKKERFRTGLFKKGLLIESAGSIALLIIKGIPFKLGYYTSKLTKLIENE